MDPTSNADQALVLAIATSWDRILARMEGGLNHIAGISFAEYRLLRAIAESPGGRGSRVDLADQVGLSSSGVTRALRPLEKLGFVENHRADRDARLALASLTAHGEELLANASGVIDDVSASLFAQTPESARRQLAGLLGGIGD
ncbi:MAG: winged helix-turn-helix transcriptional regulator [Bosea sp.]|jgi:DNA-binding MarR family transcriptional regulator|uniref:MarR family winged helix-turn-helix transcriptional regulator n=1 Tax=Bosea sp. (in: a-proteobacteria) TaxID=1871050 RepID=UPI0023A34594|nr:winged helix-turn-helix transcriptional regulator [Bosea sp. (in: a-proteobacteria)]MDG2028926.1 MarR family winged helix-turn-helix transcriptional regulator [Acidimicrobiales bacterium]